MLNVYIEGNRVIVTATCKVFGVDPDPDVLTTPSTWTMTIRNLASRKSEDGALLTFTSAGPLPEDVNASTTVPSDGIIKCAFDIDEPGERAVVFKGTGACKCAGKLRFMVEEGEAL